MRTLERRISSGNAKIGGAVLVYLIGALCLEMQIPDIGFNIRNLLMSLCSIVVIWFASSAGRGIGYGYKLAPHDWVYGAYLTFCLMSAIWSPSPLDTVAQVGYLLALWLAAMGLADAGAPLVVRQLARIVPLVAAISLAMIFVSPGAAFQPFSSSGVPELRGVFAHQQRLGLLMALTLGILFFAYVNGEGRALAGPLLGGGGLRILLVMVCLVAAAARSYTAFMVISILVTWSIAGGKWRRWLTLFLMSYLVLIMYYNFDAVADLFNDSDADLTLTGRTSIWERTLAVANEAPLIGHGYSSFFNAAYDYIWPRFRPGHANNSFVNAYFETGIIGVSLISVLLISHLRTAYRAAQRERRYPYSFFVAILTILSSQTGVTYAGKPSVLFAILLLLLSVESRASGEARLQGARVQKAI